MLFMPSMLFFFGPPNAVIYFYYFCINVNPSKLPAAALNIQYVAFYKTEVVQVSEFIFINSIRNFNSEVKQNKNCVSFTILLHSGLLKKAPGQQW